MTEPTVVQARTTLADALKSKETLEQEIDDSIRNFEFSTGLQVLAVDIKWYNIPPTIDSADEDALQRQGVRVEVHL